MILIVTAAACRWLYYAVDAADRLKSAPSCSRQSRVATAERPTGALALPPVVAPGDNPGRAPDEAVRDVSARGSRAMPRSSIA